jgi:hypothetical protein
MLTTLVRLVVVSTRRGFAALWWLLILRMPCSLVVKLCCNDLSRSEDSNIEQLFLSSNDVRFENLVKLCQQIQMLWPRTDKSDLCQGTVSQWFCIHVACSTCDTPGGVRVREYGDVSVHCWKAAETGRTYAATSQQNAMRGHDRQSTAQVAATRPGEGYSWRELVARH